MTNRVEKKPEWLQKRFDFESLKQMEQMLRSLNLHTVCEGARCPNMGECFRNRTATFMILGEVCTRNCKFCAIEQKRPTPVDPNEPKHIAEAVETLGLKHVVVTSVTRDDLPDEGAQHFVDTIHAIKALPSSPTVEVLIPDMNNRPELLEKIARANPDILNHNVETVPELYAKARPMANYRRSLNVLKYFKENGHNIVTKSGIMLGLGESQESVLSLMDDLREYDCDILTIGQYLPPSKAHLKLEAYIHPDQFAFYKEEALKRGFKFVASGPYVRSSYQAAEGMKALRNNK